MDRRGFLKVAAAASVGAAAVPAITRLGGSMTEPAQSVLWPFSGPVLDQGKIGSCTGNAVTQWSNTEYARAISKRTAYLTEPDAVQVYHLAEKLDGLGAPFYDDRGSTGDAACSAAVELGWLKGYENVKPTVDGIITALREQPLIVGSTWMSDMFNPDASGLVSATGSVAGGHEYVILGFDIPAGVFTCLNSWSDSWGVHGGFCIKFDDLVKIIADPNPPSAVTAPIARDF